jgi:hypothetical protein
MSIEAMKQALEALEEHGTHYARHEDDYIKAITALREAIEFEEMVKKGTKAWADTPDGWVDDLRGGAEPVAWIKEQELAYMSAAEGVGETQWKTNLGLKPEPGDVPLYTAPLPPIYTAPIPPPECQTEEEKRAYAFGWWKAWEKKKQWVSLTDEEIKEIVGPWGETPIKGYTRKLFDAIEAKLREKNT